jgi:polysaccharide export outer membrane protein
MTSRDISSLRRANWVVTGLLATLVLLTLDGPPWRLQAQVPGNYVIGPRDVLNIIVYEQADLAGKYTVEADGTFTFWQIGRVKAAGLTLRAFEAELTARLAAGYFRTPHVSVTVDQYRSQFVNVLGEVRNPGTYPLTGDMSLMELIARAGSVLPTASGEILIVHRVKVTQWETDDSQAPEIHRVNLSNLHAGQLGHVLLLDGDSVIVPRAETLYVFGEVKTPGAYPVQPGMTVLQALSLAGGLTVNASQNRIYRVRVDNGKMTNIKIKVTDTVKAGDTIIVKERFF